MNEPVPVSIPSPPDPVTVIVVLPPLQATLPAVAAIVTAEGSVIATDVVTEQPLASVTTYVWVPALTIGVPVPEMAPVPPAAVMLTVVVPPLHRIVPAVADALSNAGSASVREVDAEHPFISLTV